MIFIASLLGLMFTTQLADAQDRRGRDNDRREYRQDDGRRGGRSYDRDRGYRDRRMTMNHRRMKAHRMHHRHMHRHHMHRPYRTYRGCF